MPVARGFINKLFGDCPVMRWCWVKPKSAVASKTLRNAGRLKITGRSTPLGLAFGLATEGTPLRSRLLGIPRVG